MPMQVCNDPYTKSQYNKHLPALPPSPTRGHQSEAQCRPKSFDTGTDSLHQELSISHLRSTAMLPAGLHDASEYLSRPKSRRIDFPEGNPVTNGSKGRTTVKADVPVPAIELPLRPPTSQFDAIEIALQSPTAVESYELAFPTLHSGPRLECLGSNRCKHSIRRLDIQKRILNENSGMEEVGITPPDRWQEVTDQTIRLKRRRRVMKREILP
ncbi:hypothetical protein FS842_007677 [Serendipita sp. 407]|nr:hypothetical protein FS842_007677 [Serendipita sp. 407]